jgi:hypothetical protein
MNEPDQIEAFYRPSYKFKSIPVLILINLPLALRVAWVYYKGAPDEMYIFYLGIFFLVFIQVAITIPALIIIFNRRPALVLSERSLWILETGDLYWESIKNIQVTSALGEKTIRIIPKDKSILRNVPLLFKFQCWMNLTLRGNITSLPGNGLTITGEDFIKYVTEKQRVPVEQ